MLAFRAKMFMDAYKHWHNIAEINILQLTNAVFEPYDGEATIQLTGAQEFFTKNTRLGGILFVGGVICIVASALLNAYLAWMSINA